MLMFTKIVSQLSLSPSATSQLVFYARRLKAESVTRTFSAIAAILIVGLQFATILAPPTPSNAASANDIIYGGFVSKADLLNHYDDSSELKALYDHFGISRQDVVNSHVTTINSRDHSLKSIGRIQHLASDEKIVVGSNVYWSRGLYTWDTGANIQRGSTYQVLEGTRSVDGGYFAIMFACGNIVYINLPPKPTPTPPPAPPTPKPSPTPKPVPTAKPTISCLELIGNDTIGSTSSTAPLTISYTGMGSATGQSITQYEFSFGDGTSANLATADTSHTYTQVGKFLASLKVKGSTGTVSSTPPACTYTVNITPAPAAYTKSKSALNLTQNIDATTSPANAGDSIRYILNTQNTGATAGQYTVVEHLEDVLQYADVTNTGGGTLDNGVMTWPVTTIQPGGTLTETFIVTVKNPIPATPVGVSDKYSYDLRMDNVYGNAVSIAISPPVPKQIEAAAASLPDTGASTASTIVLIVCALSLFFYLRNRQLIAEIKVLRGDYHGGA
jgi:hypothetical protein